MDPDLIVYADVAPGRCYHCKDKLARVSAGANHGKFAFVRINDEIGNDVVSHVSCNDRHKGSRATVRQPDGDEFYIETGPRGWSDGRLTSRKRGAE